jgi:hypothetical protein
VRYETRAVLAAAYRRQESTMLTHTVKIDTYESEVGPLCRRVYLDSLADPCADDPSAPPTCPVCRKRDPRFHGEGL